MRTPFTSLKQIFYRARQINLQLLAYHLDVESGLAMK